MSELTVRTPQIIAVEINSIKDQARKMALSASIEIGRRLAEAKAMIEHGRWGKWLKESVDYSQSTANNLMRIYDEYGANQISLFGEVNSQALGNLSYTQAVALLGIAPEEREAFIEEHDVDNMSTRELQEAIKEAAALRDHLAKAEGDAKAKEEENAKLRDKNRELDQLAAARLKELEQERENKAAAIESLNKQIEDAQAAGSREEVEQLEQQLKKAQAIYAESQDKIKELEEELNKPIEPAIVEVVPDDVTRELEELRAKLTQGDSPIVTKFSVQFKTLTTSFSELLGTLQEMKSIDSESYERYASAVNKLISTMTAKVA